MTHKELRAWLYLYLSRKPHPLAGSAGWLWAEGRRQGGAMSQSTEYTADKKATSGQFCEGKWWQECKMENEKMKS